MWWLFLVLCDVGSLLTSFSLNETIEIAAELVFQNKPNLKISKNELKQLFKFEISGAHSLIKGNLYDLSTPTSNLLWKKKPTSFYHF